MHVNEIEESFVWLISEANASAIETNTNVTVKAIFTIQLFIINLWYAIIMK